MAKRYLMWVLASIFLSVLCLSFIPLSFYLNILIVEVVATVSAVLIKWRYRRTLVSCLVAALIATSGFYALNLNIDSTAQNMAGKEVYIEGKITDVGDNSAHTLSCYKIRVDQFEQDENPLCQPFYIYLYSREFSHSVGERFCGKISFFEEPLEYGRGKEERIFLSGMEVEDSVVFYQSNENDPHRILYSFRSSLLEKLKYGNDNTKGLLKAVCFGDKNDVESNLCVSLKRIGLSHVMAVSGLHLSFIVLLFGYFFIFAGINYRIRYIIGIFISIFFTITIGFPSSCVRACIMLVIFSLGMALGWISDSLTSLSIAAVVILFLNPFAIRDVGFLLSVSATAGIILLQAPIENFLFPKKIGKDYRLIAIYRKFTGAFACSVAAVIGTLPIMILVFQSVSLIAPFANLLLIYPFQFFFIFGILMVVLGWIPFVGPILGFCCDLIYKLIDLIANLLSKYRFASVQAIDWAGFIFLALFINIIAISLYLFHKHQMRVFLLLFIAFFGLSTVFNAIYTHVSSVNQIEIAFIDVGQGDCTVISKGNRAIIFDYGGSSDKRYNLIDYLHNKEIYQVELLAYTHLHNDHTNGIFTLTQNTFIDRLIYPPLDFDVKFTETMFKELSGEIICENTQMTVLDDVVIHIYTDAVGKPNPSNENESCVCYKVEFGSAKILITGDLDGKGELELLDQPLDCSILKVGHHGSNSSSFYPFLKAVSPEISIISVGENNYGLPDTEVVSRLNSICKMVLDTKNEGTIVFISDGNIIKRIDYEN